MKRENTGRKTDTNSMKCQTFFDSCQIFHHFDFLSNMENHVKFSCNEGGYTLGHRKLRNFFLKENG